MEIQTVRAVVTGGASGLGAACAQALYDAGASLVVCDVDAPALRRFKARFTDAKRLHSCLVDVTDERAVDDFVEEADEHLGGINVAISSAGILRDGLLVDSGPDGQRGLPIALWQRVLAVNLTGPFLMARAVVQRMLARNLPSGLIVNVSSLARTGNAGQSAYAASKAGLDACTRTWALELGRYGIRVVGVAPGVFETPMLEHISGEAKRRMMGRSPLGRFGRAEEFWPAVKLAIESEYLTGRTLEIDGGASLD